MDDDRFKKLKSERIIKNKRGREWVDVPKELKKDTDESDDDSQDSDDVIMDGSDVEDDNLDPEDLDSFSDYESDIDFDNLTKDSKITEKSTNRLAVLHFDYEDYSLAYLVELIKSGMPKGGRIKNITKYPTEEYMQRFEDDIKFGPKEYRVKEYNGDQNDDEQNNSDSDSDSNELCAANKQYAVSRLKFFITVMEFDSVETCDQVYDSLNECSLGDSGLKLDLRYVPEDKTFEIPDQFMHLVQTQRTITKTKCKGFKPGCFAQSKYKKTWDETPSDKIDFYEKALVESDIELSDIEDYCGGATESEFSGTESESEFYTTVDGPIIPKLRRKRVPIEDVRAKLGLGKMEDNSSAEEFEEEDDDEDEHEEEIVEDLDSEGDDYVVDQTVDYDEDNEESSADDDEPKKKSEKKSKVDEKKKKIKIHEKAKLMIKENAAKRETKLKEKIELLKKMAQTDDRHDALLTDFKISRDDPKYEDGILFRDYFLKERARILGVEFNVPENDTVSIKGPSAKKRRVR